MPTRTPLVTLHNGVQIPQLGFGVFQVPDDVTTAAVAAALSAGYRSIDTAAIYGNEVGTGRGLAESGIDRSELFVTTKLWNAAQGYDTTLAAFDVSLGKLGLDYLDLYLIHWPSPARDLYLETWRAFETLYADGPVGDAGLDGADHAGHPAQGPQRGVQQEGRGGLAVGAGDPEHLQRVLDLGGTVPAVNQIEVHPALQQRAIIEFNDAHGIRTEAWSPLAKGTVLADPVIIAIAARTGRTPAQVVLRWHIQLGAVPIPKSGDAEHQAENLDVFGFELSADEMAAIATLESGRLWNGDPDTHEEF